MKRLLLLLSVPAVMWEGALKAMRLPKFVSANTETSAAVPFILRRYGGGVPESQRGKMDGRGDDGARSGVG